MSFGYLIIPPFRFSLSHTPTPFVPTPPPSFICSTHVAGTACGHKYGVATNCTLCSIKVLNSAGFGSFSSVISGIQHAVNYCSNSTLNVGVKKCVINLSLGGGFSVDFNQAVASAVASGVVVVAAAGNNNIDACGYSPGSETTALTVGATNSSDMMASFSNYGACVDVFAPGDAIVSASITSVSAVGTMRGTSQATPREFSFSSPQYEYPHIFCLIVLCRVLLFTSFRLTN